jgi:hypothetical protein
MIGRPPKAAGPPNGNALLPLAWQKTINCWQTIRGTVHPLPPLNLPIVTANSAHSGDYSGIDTDISL